MTDYKNFRKNSINIYCNEIVIITSNKKSDYNKHLSTNKHKNNELLHNTTMRNLKNSHD